MNKRSYYRPGLPLNKTRLVRLFIQVILTLIFIFPGRQIGHMYFNYVNQLFFELPLNYWVNFFFWALLAVLLLFPLENRFIWTHFFGEKLKKGAYVFSVAPISLGLVVGFLSI